MTEKKEPATSAHAPMDPKKKKILIGAGVAGVLVLGYLWYRNQSSSSTSATGTANNPNTSGLTSYVGSGGGTSPITINNTANGGAGGAGGFGGSGPTLGGGTSTSLPSIVLPPNKGGKTHIHHTVVKHGRRVSGGTGKRSGATATQRTINIRAANQRKISNIRAANQRKISNVKAANQRRLSNRVHANAVNANKRRMPGSHVLSGAHSFTHGGPIHTIVPAHRAGPNIHYRKG